MLNSEAAPALRERCPLTMNTQSPENFGSEVETALLDAELFVKYRAPERAIKRLRTALERSPRSIALRERLRDIAAANKQFEEAARQCLALASLYIDRQDFDTAHDRLLEARQLDPRINITPGLEAIRSARRPQGAVAPPVEAKPLTIGYTLSGDLSAISIFDAIQVVENARLNGIMTLASAARTGKVFFNDGQIVDADCAGVKGERGFRLIVEITSGEFQFQKTPNTFPIKIQATSNTNLILDALRQMDEEKV